MPLPLIVSSFAEIARHLLRQDVTLAGGTGIVGAKTRAGAELARGHMTLDLVNEPKVAQPAMLLQPPVVQTAAEAVKTDGFVLRGGLVDAWFLRRSDVLLVTFDNLSSIGEYDPPQPWLQARAAKAGVSILGLLASRKDWYRNPNTPALITALRDAGLFAQFRRVVFVGASMGGFAALAYALLVPGAAVLAFSPQTSLSRKVAPFERRYRYAARKWDWETPAHLDAALIGEAEVYVVYDPFVAEDKLHARRIIGPGVRHLPVGHLGHRAIRQLKSVGALQSLIEAVAAGQFDPVAFAKAYRGRRSAMGWQRALLAEAEARGHFALARRAAERLLQTEDNRHLRKAMERFSAASAATIPDANRVLTIGSPQPPFAGTILHLHGAYVVPERDHDTKLASGVLLQDRSWCELSKAWIRARKITPAPTLSPDEPIRDLPGRHLFAGHYRGHFGHFLVESTARLWAVDHIGPIDSILYLPYRGQVGAIEKAIEGHESFFHLLGIDTPVRTYGMALRVEQLYVPELGFGWMDRYAGSPAYRAFTQGRLNAAVQAEGSDKLYISRAKLNAQRGGILGETVIEENLARAGYEIFHPERHPMEVQIARYKAARQIVALDGSALHLAAYVLQHGSRVAMILRRSKANAADYDLQFRSFCGVTPAVIDVVRRDWIAGDATRVDFRSIGEIDFQALFDRLKTLALLPPDFRPDLPSLADMAAMLDSYRDRRGEPFRTLQPGERFPDETEE